MAESPDFIGMATAYGVLCSDGRVIKNGAFDDQDGQTVPLVWRHGHDKITNVVGHGILRSSSRPPGMRVEGYFNSTSEGKRSKILVQGGDVKHLSIWANEIKEHGVDLNQFAMATGWGNVEFSEDGKEVFGGVIREVSLVLAGANPGAHIEDVIRHSDDPFESDFVVLDGVLIHTDFEIDDPSLDPAADPETTPPQLDEDKSSDTIKHYGKKGMRWGVRNEDEPAGGPSGSGQNAASKSGQSASASSTSSGTKPAAGTTAGPTKPSGPPQTAVSRTKAQVKALEAQEIAKQAELLRSMGQSEAADQLEADYAKQLAEEEAATDGEATSEDASLNEEDKEEEEEKKEKGGGGGGGSKGDKDDKKDKRSDESRKKALQAAQAELAEGFKSQADDARKKTQMLQVEADNFKKIADDLEASIVKARKSGNTEEASKLAAEWRQATANFDAKKGEVDRQNLVVTELDLKYKEWAEKAGVTTPEEKDKNVKHGIVDNEGYDDEDIVLNQLTSEELKDLTTYVDSLDNGTELTIFVEVDDVIEHYGVKGMKWGVRKDASSGGKSSKSARAFTFKEKLARKVNKLAIVGTKSTIADYDEPIENLSHVSKVLEKDVGGKFISPSDRVDTVARLNHLSESLSRPYDSTRLKKIAGDLETSDPNRSRFDKRRDINYIDNLSSKLKSEKTAYEAKLKTYEAKEAEYAKRDKVKHEDDMNKSDIISHDDPIDVFLDELDDSELEDLTSFLEKAGEEAEVDLYIFHEDAHGDHIAHFGVKGMRWGVRRTKEQLGRAGAAVKSNTIFKDDKSALESAGRFLGGNKGAKLGARANRTLQEQEAQANILDPNTWGEVRAVKGIASRISGKLKAKQAAKLEKEASRLDKSSKSLKSDIDKADDTDVVDHIKSRKSEFESASLVLAGAAGMKKDQGSAATKRLYDLSKTAEDFSKGRFESDVDYSTPGQAKTKATKGVEALSEAAKIYSREAESWKPKKAKHSEYPEEGDILHEIVEHADESIGDIIQSLNEDQRQLFTIVAHTAMDGEKLPQSDSVNGAEGPTIGEVFNTLSEEQVNVLYYMAGTYAEQAATTLAQEDTIMTTNIFENTSGNDEGQVLVHEQKEAVRNVLVGATKDRPSSLRERFADNNVTIPNSISHSITNVSNFFPDAQNVHAGGPEFYSRPMEWVEKVLGATAKRPFSRIRSMYADITADAARAKGYVTGNQKVQEVIIALKRSTTPQTIYKLQKLERDDILDITDFDVVMWLKNEMRLMLREELARAILITDGRDDTGNDAILSSNVRPIYSDDAAYTILATHNDVGNVQDLDLMSHTELIGLIDFIATAMKDYRGKGRPTFYCQPEVLTAFMLVRDADGRRVHKTEAELASALRVADIVEVPPMSGMEETGQVDPAGIPAGTYDLAVLGVIVNLADYVIGMDRGGETNFFDDFDIDYNRYAYLYETRLSGALVNPKSAVTIKMVTAKTA